MVIFGLLGYASGSKIGVSGYGWLWNLVVMFVWRLKNKDERDDGVEQRCY
jgi:hypothetical protein